MTKNQGRENHSVLFANDCNKKCISVREILQEGCLYELNLLVTKKKISLQKSMEKPWNGSWIALKP